MKRQFIWFFRSKIWADLMGFNISTDVTQLLCSVGRPHPRAGLLQFIFGMRHEIATIWHQFAAAWLFWSVHVAMHKHRDYVEMYKKDLAKWALLRNITTVMTHSTLLPVRTPPLWLNTTRKHNLICLYVCTEINRCEKGFKEARFILAAVFCAIQSGYLVPSTVTVGVCCNDAVVFLINF